MKAITSADSSIPQKALIFIPDISGFTSFVSGTEMNHARHIIQELLQTIIDANVIRCEVSEVEGDAILFYRFGLEPDTGEVLEQMKRMFVSFHQHLQRYETQRICNCGACRTAHQLSIKFIAHYGDVSLNRIQQFTKLFGRDVIVAHRLLKNEIDSHEYALITRNLSACCPHWADVKAQAWAPVHHASQEYDSGKIEFDYIPMESLKDLIPPLTEMEFGLKGFTSKILETTRSIKAPMDLVFNVVADLRWRAQWIPGLMPEIEDMNSEITQAGQTHKCLAGGPVMIGHDYHLEENQITFTETDVKKTFCTVYIFTKTDEETTNVSAICYMPRNRIMEFLFKVMEKKKYQKMYDTALSNLDAYCSELSRQHRKHQYQIQLTAN